MANFGRGAYEPPSDEIHIFDGSEDDMDVEGSRLPLLIVIALFVLAAFGGVVWLAYTQGVARGRSDVPRVIAAEPGPAKVAVNDQQSATPYKGLKIYQQPAPSDEEADQQAAPREPAKSQSAEQEQVATPETAPITPPKSEAPQQQVAEAAPPPAAPPKTVAEQEASAPPAKLAAKPAAPQASIGAGAYVLQIGAYKTEAEASAAWQRYQAKHAATLTGYSQDVKMVDLGAKGVWYRLRVGSFPDKQSAMALCNKLEAEGGACFPAK
ncbi:MAG TPA: SPOR domain-containing protein [Rhizomicrobium sp.]|jgi:cell division protein FtsN|nr:SPOR domain-containing protein [Rhizomicrobium sp.]